MPQPSFPAEEIERAARLYHEAVAAGASPMGKIAKFGTVSAISEVMAETGWAENSLRRRLRHAAHRGLIGGPAIPDAATPPDGFAVTRNSGEYDADGALRRQWIETRRDAGEVFEVPAGHVVKGESALVDPEGRVLAKWIKTKEGAGAGLIEALREAFAAHAGASPAVPAPPACTDDEITIYPVTDLHLGQFSWPEETGDDYSVEITVRMATDCVSRLVSKSNRTRKAVLIFMGDYFHANDAKAQTPGSGHALDVDGRWPKVYLAGAKLAVSLVEIAAAGHDEVEIVVLEGNHDRDAAVTLRIALALFFENQPRITVCMSAGIAWYRRFGKCLFGATHGHTMKPQQMVNMLVVDRAEDWGQTKHRSFFYGHIHHETAKEIAGVRVESFSSPAGKDSFNASHGYRSGRAMQALTFHERRGEVCRHRVNIEDERQAA